MRAHVPTLADLALEALAVGVTLFDADGVVLEVQGSAFRPGVDPGTAVGESLLQRYADNAELLEGVHRCLSGLTTDLVTEDGDRLWQLHFEPHGPGGVLVVQDVTRWLPTRPAASSSAPTLPSPLLDFLDRDEVTGLPGRRALQKRLLAALPTGAERALAVLNLDGFAIVNSEHGAAAGDDVLRTLAERFREEGGAALLGRWHADEFMVVVEGAGAAGRLGELVERLVAAAAEPILLARDGRVVSVTVTAGLVASHDVRARDMLPAAHTALRAARRAGPGRAEWYRAGMYRLADPMLRRHLGTAVSRGELVLHYQPVLTVEGSRLRGVEALVRWKHPDRGLLMPGEFVELAERTGDIVEMGRWVLHTAAVAARQLVAEGRRNWVSVNLSARQLADRALARDVLAVLEETGCPPDALVLEVTETAVMADLDAAVAMLQRIKELGVRLALDDFGTGYSSLLYLKRFPVDKIKIDRAFVGGLGTAPDDTAIVASTVSLARQLGLVAVAEGVESPSQLTLLRRLGCQLAQGYLFARPLPLEALHLWMAAPHGPHRSGDSHAQATEPVVGLALQLHAEGASLHTIAAALNNAGERTAQGTRWSTRSVAQIIADQQFPGLS